MWGKDDVIPAQAVGDEWFALEHVKRCSRDEAPFQRIDESRFLNDGTTCGIDQKRGPLHPGKFCWPNQPACCGVERNVERKKIGLLEYRVSRHVFGVQFLFDLRRGARCAVVDDAHTETRSAPGNGPSDAAESDDAQGFAPDVGSAKL